MYAKIFRSMYDGTLRGKAHELLVFTNMLASCDRDGCVDKHPRAIADEVGLTVEQVQAALATLEAPDPESRSPEHDGRRIVRLDTHRAWGWLLVNFAKYRAIRNEEDRMAQNREAQARYRAKHVSTSKPSTLTVRKVSRASAVSAQAEAEAQAEAQAEPEADTDTYSEHCPDGIASLPASAGWAGPEPPPLNEQARRALRLVEALAIVAKSPISVKNQKRAQRALAALVTTGRDPVAILNDLSGRAYEAKNPGGYLLAALESEAKSDAA